MYDSDGDFGKVRLVQDVETKILPEILNYSLSFGWHKCNEKYKITRENGTNRFLILFTISGKGVLKANDTAYELTANTIAIIPPDIPHEYFAINLWQFYWIHPLGLYSENVLKFIINEKGFVFIVNNINLFSDKIEHLLLLNSAKSYHYDVEASLIISELLHSLISKTIWLNSEKNRENKIIKEIKDYFETNYKGHISLEVISKKLYISTAHLIRVFKAKTGLTPYEYLIRYRIIKACELLEFTNLQIKQISKEVGFKSTSNFISHFKLIKGDTPTTFKNNL